jgi:hypothetical protein
MGGSPIWWIIGGLVVLALLWFLFSRLATSDRGAESGAEDQSGPSGAAWEQKFPDSGGAGGGPDEGEAPPRS